MMPVDVQRSEKQTVSTRLLLWVILFSVVLIFLSPGVGGDSQVYHLPNIVNILKSGSLADFQPQYVYRPAAITTYYPRGFEAVCALFYHLPFPGMLIIAFKLLLFFSFYILLRRENKSRSVALALFAFLMSMELVRGDLGNLKNDLVMAVPLVWAAVMVCSASLPRYGLWAIPLACAVALTIKASALLYTAPILLLWLWKYRSRWEWQLFYIATVILLCGLYFYWINWIYLGNPLFPLEVRLGEWVLFAGKPGGLFHTTVLSNMNLAFPGIFARGLLRAVGPGGLLGLVTLGLWVVATGLTRRDDRSASGILQLTILISWVFVFLVTPFSDNNGAIHNLLYSGNTIRLAFPAILLTVLMGARLISAEIECSSRKRAVFLWGLAGASLINLFWYDLTCILAKPENAWALLAPVVQSFDNRILSCWLAGIALVCAVVICVNKRWLTAGVVIAAVWLQQVSYPKSLGYTMRFKQLGQASQVFSFLEQQEFTAADCVAVCSEDESSFFLACANDYLLPRTGRMFYAELIGESASADWVILCAKDAFGLTDHVYGRRYRASWDFLDGVEIPKGFMEVFHDRFYRVFAKNCERVVR